MSVKVFGATGEWVVHMMGRARKVLCTFLMERRDVHLSAFLCVGSLDVASWCYRSDKYH
jgi:hypothetical protein